MAYRIMLSPECPRYAPLHGWRRLLNKYLRIQFKRPTYIFFAGNNTLVCNPESLGALARYCEQNKIAYTVDRGAPQLRDVSADVIDLDARANAPGSGELQ